MKKLQPNADYGHLTLVGHSNGGDTAMYFAKQHPELVSKVVTLDNLRVPFVLSDKMKILSFRSKDPEFQTDPGVLPTPQQAKSEGVDIIPHPVPAHLDERPRPRFRERANPGDARRVSGPWQRQRTGAGRHQ